MIKGLSQEEKAAMLPLFKGSRAALEIIDILISITHIWDDLIDKDKPVTDAEINSVFYNALVTLPRNPLFQMNQERFVTTLENAIFDWMTSCKMETCTMQNLRAAWVLRTSLSNITVQLAQIVGGFEHAQAVSDQIKNGILDDWDEYRQEHERVN